MNKSRMLSFAIPSVLSCPEPYAPVRWASALLKTTVVFFDQFFFPPVAQ